MRGKTRVRISPRGLVATKKGKPSGESQACVLRVMRERGLLTRSRRLRARLKKEWATWKRPSRAELAIRTWRNWRPTVGWAYLVCGIDCRTREIVGWILAPLPNPRCAGSGRAGGARTSARGQPLGQRNADYRQWHAVHFFPVHRQLEPAEHHPPTHGVSSSGRQ